MDLVKLGELGAVILAMLCILVLVEVIRRRYRESDSGERRTSMAPMAPIIECPNRIKELPITLNMFGERLGDLIALATKQNELIFHTFEGVERLVGQHAPVGGVEQWKVGADTLKMFRENQKDHQELLEEVKLIVVQHGRILKILESRTYNKKVIDDG